METIKNNFQISIEEIKENLANENPTFEGVNLNDVFAEIENSLEEYRLDSDKKYNDSKMELANVFLSD